MQSLWGLDCDVCNAFIYLFQTYKFTKFHTYNVKMVWINFIYLILVIVNAECTKTKEQRITNPWLIL